MKITIKNKKTGRIEVINACDYCFKQHPKYLKKDIVVLIKSVDKYICKECGDKMSGNVGEDKRG